MEGALVVAHVPAARGLEVVRVQAVVLVPVAAAPGLVVVLVPVDLAAAWLDQICQTTNRHLEMLGAEGDRVPICQMLRGPEWGMRPAHRLAESAVAVHQVVLVSVRGHRCRLLAARLVDPVLEVVEGPR